MVSSGLRFQVKILNGGRRGGKHRDRYAVDICDRAVRHHTIISIDLEQIPFASAFYTFGMPRRHVSAETGQLAVGGVGGQLGPQKKHKSVFAASREMCMQIMSQILGIKPSQVHLPYGYRQRPCVPGAL